MLYVLLQNSLSNIIKGLFINIPQSSNIYGYLFCVRCEASDHPIQMKCLSFFKPFCSAVELCMCQLEEKKNTGNDNACHIKPILTWGKLLQESFYKANPDSILNSRENSWSVICGHWWKSIESLVRLRTEVHRLLREKAVPEKDRKKEEKKCQRSNNGHLWLKWELIRINKMILLDSAGQKSLVLYFRLRNENGN